MNNILTKICKKCNIEYNISYFVYNICKKCTELKRKEWRDKNKDLLKEKSKIFRMKNSEKIKNVKIKYSLLMKEKNKEIKSTLENKTCIKCKESKDICFFYIKRQNKDGYENKCKECSKKYVKYLFDNIEIKIINYKKCNKCNNNYEIYNFYKDKHSKDGFGSKCKECCRKNRNLKNESEYRKKYKLKNKEKMAETYKKYMNNPKNRLKKRMSTAIYKLLDKRKIDKNYKSTWLEILPYTTEDLIKHLESKFKKGMTWENYGKEWHVDHVTPDSWFNYKEINDEEFKKSWALENLQPLWAKDNLSKHNRYKG